jgi:hypothetical protein
VKQGSTIEPMNTSVAIHSIEFVKQLITSADHGELRMLSTALKEEKHVYEIGEYAKLVALITKRLCELSRISYQ